MRHILHITRGKGQIQSTFDDTAFDYEFIPYHQNTILEEERIRSDCEEVGIDYLERWSVQNVRLFFLQTVVLYFKHFLELQVHTAPRHTFIIQFFQTRPNCSLHSMKMGQ